MRIGWYVLTLYVTIYIHIYIYIYILTDLYTNSHTSRTPVELYGISLIFYT